MATGTGNLPNPGMAFTPFDILLAEEMNDLVENIESLADGTGIGDASVTSSKLATGIQTLGVATAETTTSTSYTGLTTPQAVTATVGANGLLLVMWGCHISNNGTNNAGRASVALSGANTVASSDDYAAYGRTTTSTAEAVQTERHKLFTGLTPGVTTVTLQFKVSAGTGTFSTRQLTAMPL